MNSSIPQVEFQEGEEIKYKADIIPLKITSNETDNFVIFNDGTLCITNQRIVFANADQKIFQLEFKNVVSHGIQDSNLVCYLTNGDGNENNDEEEYDDEEEKGYFTFLVNSKNELINIQGDFEIRFSFEKNPAADINSAFNIFSECSALNPDEQDDAHVANLMGGMMGFDFESMVTAKDIDENGNLISNKLGFGENEGEGDEDEEEEYTDDEEEEEVDGDQQQDEEEGKQNKQNKENNMDLE